MPHFANDALPTGAAVAVPAAFLDRLHDLLVPVSEHATAALEDRSTRDVAPPAVLSDAQFAEIKALLQPGFELATALLEDRRAAVAAKAPGREPIEHEPVKPVVHAAAHPALENMPEPVNLGRSESEKGSG